jgi:uncharacterized protein (DUF1330 family)
LQKYGEKAPGTVAAFNGRYVVRGGGKIQALEGEPPKGYVMVIAFESAEKARAWYDSPDYEAIRGIRQRATNSRLFIADGIAPQWRSFPQEPERAQWLNKSEGQHFRWLQEMQRRCNPQNL